MQNREMMLVLKSLRRAIWVLEANRTTYFVELGKLLLDTADKAAVIEKERMHWNHGRIALFQAYRSAKLASEEFCRGRITRGDYEHVVSSAMEITMEVLDEVHRMVVPLASSASEKPPCSTPH